MLLHGWGQNIQMMDPIRRHFRQKYNTLTLDLPGFGQSEEPPIAWSIYDYTDCLRKLITHLKLNKIIFSLNRRLDVFGW